MLYIVPVFSYYECVNKTNNHRLCFRMWQLWSIIILKENCKINHNVWRRIVITVAKICSHSTNIPKNLKTCCCNKMPHPNLTIMHNQIANHHTWIIILAIAYCKKIRRWSKGVLLCSMLIIWSWYSWYWLYFLDSLWSYDD